MTWWLNKCFSEFVVRDYYRLNKTFRGCSGSRFCLHQSVGSRFPLNTEAGNPSRRWKARISPSGVSSSLSGWGVIPGADRHAAPTWRPIGWFRCRSEWWCLWRTCGRKSPERGEAGMLLWSVLPGQVQWKQEFLNSLSETSARRSGAGFTLKQLSIFFNWKTSWSRATCENLSLKGTGSHSSHAVFLCQPETRHAEEVPAGASDRGWWSLQLQPSLKQTRPAEVW